MSEPTIHADWDRERCLDHLAALDQQVRSLHDRAEWLRKQAELTDTAAVITLSQLEHFARMVSEPAETLDTRPGSFQNNAKEGQ